MSVPVIMDIVVGGILLLFVFLGWKQGFVKSLAGLLIAVVALVGAAMIAGTFADPVTRLVSPVIEKTVAEKVEEAIVSQTGSYDVERVEGSAEEILQMIGIDADARKELAQRMEDTVQETGKSVVSAAVESLTRSVVYVLLFVAGFVALSLLLHVLAAAMDLVAKLPLLSTANALGGAVMGLFKGGLLIFLGIWVLRRMGYSFETANVARTYLLQFFADNTPLSVLSLLL